MTNKRTDRRPARRMGAEKRNAERLARSTQDQARLVLERPGSSGKELQKLQGRAVASKREGKSKG